MKSSLAACLLLLLGISFSSGQYRAAMPGYHYEFPRDHFNHEEFQTEWWYYTGNVATKDGHRFGFELTFFRYGISRDPVKRTTWDMQDLFLAHLALSDLDGNQFYYTERINRAGPGIAGIDAQQGNIWNGNWQVAWKNPGQELTAMEERFAFHLLLESEKPPVMHGESGVTQKAEGPGHASHYISFTRLKANGSIKLKGSNFDVSGLAWMDHEFFTSAMVPDQVGWDWFSLQLNDNTELMLYRLRRRDGSVDPFSSGTYIDAQGRVLHLRKEDFSLATGAETWKSPVTGATYPVGWTIAVPKLGITLEASTRLKSQELSNRSQIIPNYWEGAIDLKGHRRNTQVSGEGYLEMTGYDQAVKFGR